MNDRNYKVSGKKMLPKKGIREGYYAKKLRRIEEREASKQEKTDERLWFNTNSD